MENLSLHPLERPLLIQYRWPHRRESIAISNSPPLFSIRCKQERETGSLSIHRWTIALAAQILAPSHWLLPPLTSLAFYLPLVSVRSGVRFRTVVI